MSELQRVSGFSEKDHHALSHPAGPSGAGRNASRTVQDDLNIDGEDRGTCAPPDPEFEEELTPGGRTVHLMCTIQKLPTHYTKEHRS
jgi:hypothetical protein